MECECGCRQKPVAGYFMPGHDQKLRAKLEQRIGGLLHLKQLVELSESYAAGKLPIQDFGRLIKNFFPYAEI